MEERLFVDCHSHVVPSGDDGAGDIDEGRSLCVEAARRGTRILFATPHVWPQLPLTAEREQRVRRAYDELAPRLPVELRLGYELTPTRALLREDLWRYALGELGSVLMEVPFIGPPDLLFALAERAEEQGLAPVIAHPERCEAVKIDPGLLDDLAGRGWLLQVNGTSLLGRHGEVSQELAWAVVQSGWSVLVGSDGHRAERPPHLDEAYEAVRSVLGDEAARPLFDGTPLGLAPAVAGT